MIARAAGVVLAMVLTGMPALARPPLPEGAKAEPVTFAALDGWAQDDHAEAFAVFRKQCVAARQGTPALRLGAAPPPALDAVCEAALALAQPSGRQEARAFFERWFAPWRIRPADGSGFLTGYFEPQVEGSLTPTPEFPAPVYGRPPDLVTLAPTEQAPGLPQGLASARRVGDRLEEHPDRPAIYAGALRGRGLERLYLRDEAEVFIVQVQGSARVRLPDGSVVRLAYSGRSGHPYTSIGRILIDEGRIAREAMSLEALMGWLRAHPDEARRVMERNRSYVFFDRIEGFDPALGPTGGAGLPLTPGRSLAVDRTLWAYGLPVWIAATIDTLPPTEGRLARLTIAQDTGSAIVGPARADYYWGSGPQAGRRAGLTRHALDFVVLWPHVRGVP